VGLLTAAWIAKDPKSEKLFLVPLLFYSLMEFLQTVQYFYVNQCSSATNTFLTEIAYVLVIVQPLMWNLFFYYRSDKNGCTVLKTKTNKVPSPHRTIRNIAPVHEASDLLTSFGTGHPPIFKT